MVCFKDSTAIWLTANLLLSEVVKTLGIFLKKSVMPTRWLPVSNQCRSTGNLLAILLDPSYEKQNSPRLHEVGRLFWGRFFMIEEKSLMKEKSITDCSSNERGKRKLYAVYFFCVGSNTSFFYGAYHLWIINAIFLIYQTWNTCPKSYFSYYYLQWCLWSVLLENAGL